MINLLKRLLCLSFGVLLCFSSCQAQVENSTSLKNYTHSLSSLISTHPSPKDELYIKIIKSDYTLSIMKGDSILKTYPVVFGGNPVDDKKMQGDGCTPEGWFKLHTKYPHKSWSKFLWIDYPNATSRKKFATRKQQGEIPSTAQIGGDIGIHGVPKGYDHLIDEKYNWTLGCISMKNKDVDEIYPYIKKGSRILILKTPTSKY